jgi:hypothetical protein
MKKLLLLFMVIMTVSSCVTPQSGLTAYQTKNLHKFSNKKNYRTINGPRYVRPRKRGEVMHPAVKKETRKELIRMIKRQRATVSE